MIEELQCYFWALSSLFDRHRLLYPITQEENSLLIDSLRTSLKQQQAEVEQLRQHLEAANTDKSHLSHSLNEL